MIEGSAFFDGSNTGRQVDYCVHVSISSRLGTDDVGCDNDFLCCNQSHSITVGPTTMSGPLILLEGTLSVPKNHLCKYILPVQY